MPLPREVTGGISSTFPKRISLLAILPVFLLLVFAWARPAQAAGENEPLQTSGDKSYWDRKHHRVELYGHAVARQQGETLMADQITMDFVTRQLDAKGNCIYVTMDSILYGDEMHLNMDTRTGVVIGARVSNDKFTLSGERINKLSNKRFQAHWGEYSTCKDCPNSWSLESEDVDVTFGEYAYMSNVTYKIKDAPTFWLPYLIVPVKTQRQTGFLFPKIGLATNNGFMFVEPFFWAISRSVDMTVAAGEYASRGFRGEWEGRYALSQKSGGQANFYNVVDSQFASIRRNRWGLVASQTQEFPFGIDEKLKLTEVGDTFYPIDFPADVSPNGNLVLTSDLIFNYGTSDISAYIDAKRIRDIVNIDPDPNARYLRFDPTTVQLLPSGMATTNDRLLFGLPVAASLTMGVSNFTRQAGPFDYDQARASASPPSGPFTPGVDPLREATRFSYTPSLYSTLRPFDVLNLVPSAKYYGYFYSFHDAAPDLNRGYLLLQADLSTQLERVYDTPDPDRPKQKHLIRPQLIYSNIPYISEDRTHPFLEQIQYAKKNNFSGYNFDDYDIVPVDQSPSNQNYFIPLGNSLSYGFVTQLITRQGAVDKPMPSYLQNVEWTAGQSLNFRQFEYSPQDRQPFSRLYSTLSLNFGKYSSSTTYYYYPYAFPASGEWRNVISTAQTFVLERAVHQHVLTYDRSITLGFTQNQVDCTTSSCGTLDLTGNLNFSINDYLLPTVYADYSMVQHAFNTAGFGLAFQSPAQCWKVTVNVDYTVQTHSSNWTPNFLLNLTGSGFGSLSDAQSVAANH